MKVSRMNWSTIQSVKGRMLGSGCDRGIQATHLILKKLVEKGGVRAKFMIQKKAINIDYGF